MSIHIRRLIGFLLALVLFPCLVYLTALLENNVIENLFKLENMKSPANMARTIDIFSFGCAAYILLRGGVNETRQDWGDLDQNRHATHGEQTRDALINVSFVLFIGMVSALMWTIINALPFNANK